ncbi:unnamed protein product [Psylliodes chrysocephalus]|uniref:Uncharacterized protein n=1 Tax=Psylliodes chrysocephalus TaxID=3402493 RepID=A0A9P0G8U3_9CUCU|nr:unnamed protein product [Psylliodes chrysocephala]
MPPLNDTKVERIMMKMLNITHIRTHKKIHVQRDNTAIEVPICYKAMLSMHGISAKRRQNIQQQLTTFGHVKHDGRGKHSNRKNRLPDEISTVFDHIASFKGRKSHYSLHDSQCVYLPEDLNVKKMCLQQNPDKKVSYETYRTIFVTKFSISFGIHERIPAVPAMSTKPKK